MPKKSTPAGGELQLELPAPARAIDRVPTQKAMVIMNVKRMRPGLVYEAKGLPIFKSSQNVEGSKQGQSFRFEAGTINSLEVPNASYGGKWIAVWAGVNPERRSENVWDILYQQAS